MNGQEPQQERTRLPVLLVEPDAEERERLRDSLLRVQRFAIEVEAVESVQVGRERLEFGGYAAVLLGADGADALQTLEELGSIERGVPTVVVSEAALSSVAAAVLAAGADDLVLRRSTTPEVLRRVLSYAVERKRARMQLQESEDRYRSFFEADLTANFVSTPGGEIQAFNPAFARMFGVHEQVGPRPMTTVLGARVWAGMVEDLASRETDRLATELEITSERGTVYASASIIGRFDESDRLIQVQGAIRDITEQRNLEMQLRQAQKMDALGRLAGGLAHDLNNLLTVIVGNNEMAIDEVPRSAKGHLNEIKRAANRGAALVDKLLAFTRQQPTEVVKLDLNTIISEMTSLARPLVGERVEIDVSLDPRLKSVRIDKGQLEQVVLNLLVNARGAMAGGGTITVQTRPGRRNTVILRVSDEGHGMDSATKARVFDPFFTTKDVGEGTGLGLSVVYGIVEQYQGHIFVKSEPGEGATFEIVLPAASGRDAPMSPSEGPSEIIDARGDETVLLVEDELGLRTLLESALAARGFKVMAALDAHQALRLLRIHGDVDLLLTDVVMPRMSGPELAERVLQASPETRIVFMSGYPDPKLEGNPLDLSSHTLIRKPFSPNEMASVIRRTLDEPMEAASAVTS
ncbi:MAG: response regulator [Acidobacteriota bacterium]